MKSKEPVSSVGGALSDARTTTRLCRELCSRARRSKTQHVENRSSSTVTLVSENCKTITVVSTTVQYSIASTGYRTRSTYSMYESIYISGRHLEQSMNQPGKVASPARGESNRKIVFSAVPVRA